LTRTECCDSADEVLGGARGKFCQEHLHKFSLAAAAFLPTKIDQEAQQSKVELGINSNAELVIRGVAIRRWWRHVITGHPVLGCSPARPRGRS
jgi:hypothetical protein